MYITQMHLDFLINAVFSVVSQNLQSRRKRFDMIRQLIILSWAVVI